VDGIAATVLKVCLAVAIGLPLVVYLAQDALIFHRQSISEARRAEIARRHPRVTEVFPLTSDGTRVHVWYVKAGSPVILYFGGNAEEVSWMIETAAAEAPGASWLLMDYRGYGQSAGSPSEKALVADAIALYDHAAKLPGVDPGRIYAFGRSLGSGVAVALAAQRRLAGLILSTPYDSLVALARRYYWFLPVGWMLKHRFDSMALAPSQKTPLLCLIAGRDKVIPPGHAERLYAAWSGPKRRVALADADHNTTDGAPQFWPAIREFLEK